MSNMKDQFYYHEEGRSLYNIKSYKKALEAFNQAIKFNPDYQEAWYYKGLTLLEIDIKNSNEAIEAFKKAIEINDKSNYASYAWYDKGITHRKLAVEYKRKVILKEALDALKEALDAFEEAIKIDPKYKYALYNKGLTLRDLGNNEEALNAFKEAIKSDTNYAEPYFFKGIVLRELADEEKEYTIKIEKYEEALKAFDNAINLKHDNINVFYNKGLVFYNRGLAFRDIGKHVEAINNFDNAIENIDKVLSKDKQKPFYFEVLNFKGYILIQYNKYPKYKEAINLYNKLFDDNSSHEWKDINQAYNNIGLAYSCIGEYEEAIKYFNFENDKKNSYKFYSEGYAYEKYGDFEAALKAYLASIDCAYKELASKDNKSPNPLIDSCYYMGLACYNRGLKPELTDVNFLKKLSGFVNKKELKLINGNKDINKLRKFYLRKALEYFEKAIEIEPHYINVWIHEARTLYELGNHKEAIDCLNEAIKINPNNGLLYTVISNIYLDVGDLDDASKNINKALKIGYESSVIWKLKGLIHIDKKEYDDSIYCLEKAILLNAENDDFIDPLLLLWKAYAKYLKIEFSSIPKDTVQYMERIHSIIRDLERTFLNEKECFGECSLYFIGCFYYKINDVFSAKNKLSECVKLCEKSKNPNNIFSPELLKVNTSACELLDHIWTYQIRPPWWKWWLDSPVYSIKRKLTFYCLLILILSFLLVPLLGSLYLILGPALNNLHPIFNSTYSLLSVGTSKVSIDWTLYLLAILLFIFILLFPSLENIKGKDFEIKINSPTDFKFELYPVMPPKKEPSPSAMGSILNKFE